MRLTSRKRHRGHKKKFSAVAAESAAAHEAAAAADPIAFAAWAAWRDESDADIVIALRGGDRDTESDVESALRAECFFRVTNFETVTETIYPGGNVQDLGVRGFVRGRVVFFILCFKVWLTRV